MDHIASPDPIDEGQALWLALRRKHPRAARLALLCCLPLRVSPALLRLARLHLLALQMPATGVGDEADLFLSELVETRAVAGFALRPGVRQFLRQTLSADTGLLDQVWQRVQQVHAPWLTPRARQEEALCWLLLRAPADPAIEAQWAGVLDELRQGQDAQQVLGLARWVLRAWADLPPGSERHESGRLVHLAAHLLLGNAAVLGEQAQYFSASQALAFATRGLPRRTVFVGRTATGLLLNPLQNFEHGHALLLPHTRPLWLQLEGPGQPPQVLTLSGEAAVEWPLPASADTLSLRLIDGSLYALAPALGDEPTTESAAQPRLRMSYSALQDGATKNVELPFVIGVLADLQGQSEQPLPTVVHRRFLDIEVENFDACMQALRPRVVMRVKNQLGGADELAVQLEFARLADFEPFALLMQIAPCRRVFMALEGWRRIGSLVHDHPHAELQGLFVLLRDDAFFKAGRRWLEQDPFDPKQSHSGVAWLAGKKYKNSTPLEVLRASLGAMTDAHVQEFAEALVAILSGDEALDALDALQPGVDASLLEGLAARVAQLHARLNAQLDLVLQHPNFQTLEGSWRGLHYLLTQSSGEALLQVRCMSINKRELAEALRPLPGSSAKSAPPEHFLHKALVEQPFTQAGGQPFGLLVGDYSFGHAAPDVALLAAIARTCAQAQTPFVAAAAPSLLEQERWSALGRVNNLAAHFDSSPDLGTWRTLRRDDDARYVALTCPRVMARLPYGSDSATGGWPFAYQETVSHPPDTAWVDSYCWSNAAYALAANIGRAFKRDGCLAQISGMELGGRVEGLPTHLANAPGLDAPLQCGPTEFPLSDRMEAILSRQGLLPLAQGRVSGTAVFFSTQTLLQAQRRESDQRAPANLADVLTLARFAHGLRCLVREQAGGFADAAQLQRFCHDWLSGFIDPGGGTFSLPPGPDRPLLTASVAIGEARNGAGDWVAELFLNPYRGPRNGGGVVGLQLTLPGSAGAGGAA